MEILKDYFNFCPLYYRVRQDTDYSIIVRAGTPNKDYSHFK